MRGGWSRRDHLSDGAKATHGCSAARDRRETDGNAGETADRGLSPHHPVHADRGHRSSHVNAAKQSGGRADAERRSRIEGRLQLSVRTEEGRGRSGRQNRSSLSTPLTDGWTNMSVAPPTLTAQPHSHALGGGLFTVLAARLSASRRRHL